MKARTAEPYPAMPVPAASAGAARQDILSSGAVRIALAGLSLAIALGTAVAGAILTGPNIGALNARIEGLSSSSGGALGDLGSFVPLGFAFSAGMVSAVNPCGFPMLPAYLGLFLGRESDVSAWPASRLGNGLRVGLTVTAGFTLLFAIAGVAIGGGAQFLVEWFPWLGLTIGVVLAAAGAWMLAGGRLYSALGEEVAGRVGAGNVDDLRGYFLFGLSYGLASLSCTLPIFLAVVGGSFAFDNALLSIGQILTYGVGMGTVVVGLTLVLAVTGATTAGWLSPLMPHVERVGAVFLLLAGSYVVYYWLTLGELINHF